nr:hypothetical protein [Brucella intermedia]
MKTVSEDKSIGARTRGAIQRGETGDKVPGFDPAAAPMETDAEAGGSSQPTGKPQPQPAKADDSNASSHASGLRAWSSEGNAQTARGKAPLREGPAYLVWWFIIAMVVIGSFITSWVWR